MRVLLAALVLLILAGPAFAAPFADPSDEVTTNPTGGGPLLGLSCGRTDLLGFDIDRTTLEPTIGWRLRDLNELCLREDPEFQLYTFSAQFASPEWNEGEVRLSWNPADGEAWGGIFLWNSTAQSGGLVSLDPAVDIGSSTVMVGLPGVDPMILWTSFYAASSQDDCAAGRCFGADVALFADRLPNEGVYSEQ